MRGILRYHVNEDTSLAPSFSVHEDEGRMFPMAGKDGTSTTRTALSKLTRLEGKAPCTDMSEDSMVFDEDDFSTIRTPDPGTGPIQTAG